MPWELIVDKKENQGYRGKAEKCTYSFQLGPEQLPGTSWSAKKIVDAHNASLAEQGSKLLECRMWEDTSPTWHTNYYVEVIASDPTGHPLPWALIITGVIVILIALIVYFTIHEITAVIEYVGEKAPITLPLLALCGIGAVALGIILVARRGGREHEYAKA